MDIGKNNGHERKKKQEFMKENVMKERRPADLDACDSHHFSRPE